MAKGYRVGLRQLLRHFMAEQVSKAFVNIQSPYELTLVHGSNYC